MKKLAEFQLNLSESSQEYKNFDMLVRMGLANRSLIQRYHKVLDKMKSSRPVFTTQERDALQDLFNKMLGLITKNQQIFTKSKQAVREDIEEAMDVAVSSDYKLSPSGRKVRARRIKVGDKVERDVDAELEKTESIEPIGADELEEFKSNPFSGRQRGRVVGYYKPKKSPFGMKPTKPVEKKKVNETMQSEHEITVGNYTTKHFHMCGSAQKVMKKHADKAGAEELTRMQDVFYDMEMKAMEAGGATEEQKKKAQILYDKIIAKAKEVGIKNEVDSYMKSHLTSMTKGKPKLGFGRTDIEEQVNEATEDLVKDPPFALVLKRKAIRMYPNKTKVALYYNKQIDKYFTIPYGPKFSNAPLQAEQVIDRLLDIRQNEKLDEVVEFANGEQSKIILNSAISVVGLYEQLNNDNKEKLKEFINQSPQNLEKMVDFANK